MAKDAEIGEGLRREHMISTGVSMTPTQLGRLDALCDRAKVSRSRYVQYLIDRAWRRTQGGKNVDRSGD